MKLVEPVLFPISVDLMEIFKLIGKSIVKEVDILGNYNFQEKHYKLISKYVDPSLLEKCFEELILPITELDVTISITVFLLQLVAKKSIYSDYYFYFLCDYLRSGGKLDDPLHFGMWLKQKHDYTYKKHAKVNYVKTIDGYYNTIVIPKMWRDISIGNDINRMYKLPVNYFDQFEMLKKAARHLIEGGKIYLLNKQDYSWVLHCLGDDFEEVEDLVFQKKISDKSKSKTNTRLWL